MNKFIPLFLGLMFPLAGAMADTFTDEAVAFCRSKGGDYNISSTMTTEGDKYCKQVTCKKTNAASGRYEIPAGETGPEANVEAVTKVCVPKSVIDKPFETAGGANGGDSSGAGSAAGGAGSAAGGAGSAAGGAGSAAGGAGSAAGGNGSGSSGDAVVCEELEGDGRLSKGDRCYDECKPKYGWKVWQGKKSGLDRKSCVECLLKYPALYKVKREFLPKDKDGKVIGDSSVDLGRGVTVKTGVIVCKDAKGNIVSVTAPNCPSGMTIHTTGGAGSGGSTYVITGSGSGSGSGAGVNVGGSINVGGGVNVGGGRSRPEYCTNPKNKKDLELCDGWISTNARYECSVGGSIAACTGGASNDIESRYYRDCVNCGGSRSRSGQSTLSGWAEIVGAAAPILSTGIGAYFGYKGQKAWANAAEAGFEQCRLSQNDYLQYLQANELPAMTPAQRNNQNCNGYNLGGFAGLGGGLNGWYAGGYSPGFIGGMLGPYGGYNPYGNGGVIGGAIGGVVGGGGLYGGGLYGGGLYGGVNAGIVGGIAGNISIAGGINAGIPGGYLQGGGLYGGGLYGGGLYGGGLYGGGLYGGGLYGGNYGGAGIAGGIQIAGGINSGYYNAGAAGGYYNAGGGNGYMDFAASQNAANYDRMLQQQGTAYQMGALGGSAAYNPMNAGFTLGGSIGGNFGMW